ncbi:UDP-3-O-(3-hydroxymyristoyl)glucosamine N-acyltransferase [Pseudohongiella acticola]|uniref:UDP-3-O-(3-hydroxymyristoyl)glucosamine N-acyltransferase n=1 Tax=Pseudohongiella acticola TaxID=1524254 RepID=UPI0030EB6180
MKPSFTLKELSRHLDVPVQGDESTRIGGLATLKGAGPGDLSFLANPRYAQQLSACRASALILHPDLAATVSVPCLLSRSPYVTYAKASQLFAAAEDSPLQNGEDNAVHASAVVSQQASLGANVSIGPNVVIENGAVIGDGSRIGAGSVIGRNCRIGANSLLYPNVTLYHGVSLGERCIIHSGAVIGADGFGFAFDGQRSVKIAQLGAVTLGDDVEVGAGSCIDRGALDDTIVEEGVKIDNQVQIGHNCVVGAHTVICGCSALAGSTRVGRYCVIGGGVGITGHLSLCDKVTVSAMSMVTQSISKPGLYSSGTLLQESGLWKRNAVTLSKLTDLSRRVRTLEQGRSDEDPQNSK